MLLGAPCTVYSSNKHTLQKGLDTDVHSLLTLQGAKVGAESLKSHAALDRPPSPTTREALTSACPFLAMSMPVHLVQQT